MSVCLEDFRYLDTADMALVPPGGSEPIATITFAGPAHEKSRAQADRLHWRSNSRARMAASRVRGLDEVERENCEFVADRILGWSGIKRREGGEVVEVPYSREYAIEMLANPALGWLFGQCLAFLSADTNFLPAPRG